MVTSKFKDLVHFIVHQCRDNPSALGGIRLNKALWFIDVTAYRVLGKSVTGERYVKRERGPVPENTLKTLEALKKEEKIHFLRPKQPYDSWKFFSLSIPDENVFLSEEKEIIFSVLKKIKKRTANDVSELTHNLVWKLAELGEEIPLCTALSSDQGELTEEDKSWADSIIKNRDS